MLYVHTARRGNLQTTMSFDGAPRELGLEGRLRRVGEALKASLKREGRPVDWCEGVKDLWFLEEKSKDPCLQLSNELKELRGSLATWDAPIHFLRSFGRWQFSVAPNVSRIEVLTELLEQTQRCEALNLSRGLDQVALDDEASLDEEDEILERAIGSLDRMEGAEPEVTSKGLLGLLSQLAELNFISQISFGIFSSWAFRIKTRGNGLQLRLEAVAQRLSGLHDALKLRDDYRRLAFNEIYRAGHWGKQSGGGSSADFTRRIKGSLLDFLVSLEASFGKISILDIGCGWGEFLPSMLSKALQEQQLKSIEYFGVDIAEKPIEWLRHRFPSFHFAALDACVELPRLDVSLAVLRHVSQHLESRDVLRIFGNLRRLQPRLFLASSWPSATNQELFLGSSAFGAQAPQRNFEGYDLTKPPFSLTEPLRRFGEAGGEELLLYPGAALDAMANL